MKNFEVVSYSDHSLFLAAVKEFDSAAVWKNIKANEIQFVPALGLDVAEEADVLAVRLPTETEAIVCRPWVYGSAKTLCQDNPGIFGKLLKKGRADIICSRLNEDLGYLDAKKGFLVLFRDGKIGGLFGDFNADWTETEQLGCLEAKLDSQFPAHTFLGGSVSHLETRAKYRLSHSVLDAEVLGETETSAHILSSYEEAFKSAGLEPGSFEAATPVLEFSTGESGLAQISIASSLRYKRGGAEVEVLLGSPQKVNHRGSNRMVWDKFEQNLTQIASVYQQGLDGICALAGIRILHPYNALTQLLRPFASSVPLEEAKTVADLFSLEFPPESSIGCSALVLYEVINDLIASVAPKVGVTKRLNNVELCARLLNKSFNWRAVDTLVAAPIGNGKQG